MSPDQQTLVWLDGAEASSGAAVQAALEGAGGRVLRAVGGAMCARFGRAEEALSGTLAALRAAGRTGRAALHVGAVDGDLPLATADAGAMFNRVTELVAAAHEGQIVLSADVVALLRPERLPPDVQLRPLGSYQLGTGPTESGAVEELFDVATADRLTGFPALRLPRSAAPVGPAPEHRPPPLPVPLTPLIGRDREMAELGELLTDGGVRLLTLTGPGGTGKTRLALAVASRLVPTFADGVRFVPLATATDGVELLTRLAGALDVPEAGAGALIDRIQSALRDRQMLIVLDNFEQIVEAGPVVTELLSGAGRVQIVVTSRAPLNLYGEQLYPVGPLGMPEPRSMGEGDPSRYLEHAAVALFVARSRAVEPGFRLTADNAAAVAELCVLLDGLPLALELAAARSRQLTPAEMLATLRSRPDGRLGLLSTDQRDRPTRQQTLRGAVGWSYQLLDEPARRTFAHLALCPAGATAEAVAGLLGSPDDVAAVGVELDRLVEQSLVGRLDGPTGVRYTMLGTICEYALEQLGERGEFDSARRAHAAHFLRWAERTAPRLVEPDQTAALDEMEVEHDNLLAALRFLVDSSADGSGDEPTDALRLAGAMGRFWYSHGHLRQGRAWLDLTLARCPTAAGPIRTVALGGLGRLAYELGDYPAARIAFEGQRALCRDLGDATGEADAFYGLGVVTHSQGDLPGAKAYFEASLVRHQRLESSIGTTNALRGLGVVALTEGDYSQAVALLEGSLALFRALGNNRDVALVLANLGRAVRLGTGDHDRAAALLVEGIELSHRTGNRIGLLGCLERLAEVEAARGQAERGALFAGAAEALREALSAPLSAVGRAFHARLLDDLRARLRPSDLVAAWVRGRDLTAEEAFALATA